MVRVVFDTVIFVRSLINPYSWSGRILFQYFSTYRLFVSRPILQEIFEVLQRSEVVSLFHTLKGLDKEKIFEIIGKAEVVEVSDIPEVSRDTKDNIFLATAKAAKADYLISADKDLLDLKKYEEVEIIDAGMFLQILKKKSN